MSWICYSKLHSTGLQMSIGTGKYPSLESAVGAAYMQMQDIVDGYSDKTNYHLTTLYYLEGGEDLAFDVIDMNTNEVETTYYFLVVHEGD